MPMVLKLQQAQKNSRKIKKILTYKSYGDPTIAMWRPRLCRRSLVPSGAGWQPGWQVPPFPGKRVPQLQDTTVRWLDTTYAQPLGGCRFYVIPCRLLCGCPASSTAILAAKQHLGLMCPTLEVHSNMAYVWGIVQQHCLWKAYNRGHFDDSDGGSLGSWCFLQTPTQHFPPSPRSSWLLRKRMRGKKLDGLFDHRVVI